MSVSNPVERRATRVFVVIEGLEKRLINKCRNDGFPVCQSRNGKAGRVACFTLPAAHLRAATDPPILERCSMITLPLAIAHLP